MGADAVLVTQVNCSDLGVDFELDVPVHVRQGVSLAKMVASALADVAAAVASGVYSDLGTDASARQAKMGSKGATRIKHVPVHMLCSSCEGKFRSGDISRAAATQTVVREMGMDQHSWARAHGEASSGPAAAPKGCGRSRVPAWDPAAEASMGPMASAPGAHAAGETGSFQPGGGGGGPCHHGVPGDGNDRARPVDRECAGLLRGTPGYCGAIGRFDSSASTACSISSQGTPDEEGKTVHNASVHRGMGTKAIEAERWCDAGECDAREKAQCGGHAADQQAQRPSTTDSLILPVVPKTAPPAFCHRQPRKVRKSAGIQCVESSPQLGEASLLGPTSAQGKGDAKGGRGQEDDALAKARMVVSEVKQLSKQCPRHEAVRAAPASPAGSEAWGDDHPKPRAPGDDGHPTKQCSRPGSQDATTASFTSSDALTDALSDRCLTAPTPSRAKQRLSRSADPDMLKEVRAAAGAGRSAPGKDTVPPFPPVRRSSRTGPSQLGGEASQVQVTPLNFSPSFPDKPQPALARATRSSSPALLAGMAAISDSRRSSLSTTGELHQVGGCQPYHRTVRSRSPANKLMQPNEIDVQRVG